MREEKIMAEIIQKTQKKTIYREGKTLVKLFNNEYPKSDVLNEALNTARVEESTTLNVPAVHEVTKVNGEWAIIQDFVEGKTMQQLMEENPDKTGELLNEFVDLQVEVLSQKVPLLSPLKDKMHRKISATKFDKTTRYDLHILLDSLPKHDKLLHGDFNPANVIVSPRRQKIYHRLGARYAGQCPLRRGENVPFVQTGRQGRPCGRIFETLFGKDGHCPKCSYKKRFPSWRRARR